MTSRRQFLSGCVLAAVPTVPVFANSSHADDFDMNQYIKELKELMDIDSKSGHVEGANQIANILAKRFKSIGWTVTTRDCEGRGKAVGRPSSQQIRLIKHTMTLFYPFIRTRFRQLETPPNIL